MIEDGTTDGFRAVQASLDALNLAIATWNRQTGRGCSVILIPQNKEFAVSISVDGRVHSVDPLRATELALSSRERLRIIEERHGKIAYAVKNGQHEQPSARPSPDWDGGAD